MAQLNLGVILKELRAARQRATYGAVGGLLGRLPRSVMQGLPRVPANSWVVLAATGEPSGYSRGQMDPALRQSHHVISDSADLRNWLDGRSS